MGNGDGANESYAASVIAFLASGSVFISTCSPFGSLQPFAGLYGISFSATAFSGQKYCRLARLERFAILCISSCPKIAFICHRQRRFFGPSAVEMKMCTLRTVFGLSPFGCFSDSFRTTLPSVSSLL